MKENSPFLDSYKNNRNNFCGKWSVAGVVRKGGKDYRHIARLGCKRWSCEVCGPKRAYLLRRAISEAASKRGLQRFLTLTLDPKHCSADHSTKYIRNSWAKLRIYLQRLCSEPIDFIAILEYQQSGYAHLHILIDRYIPQSWIQKSWRGVGGGTFVNIKFVDVHRIAAYLSKYFTKELFLVNYPLGARRYTTSRSIKLFVKAKKGLWILVKTSIEILREGVRRNQIDEKYDQHGLLNWFQIEMDQKA